MIRGEGTGTVADWVVEEQVGTRNDSRIAFAE